MSQPEDAEYMYSYNYYKLGSFYALYLLVNGSWRESASVTNEMLIREGVKL
jgi:hypothetical protein